MANPAQAISAASQTDLQTYSTANFTPTASTQAFAFVICSKATVINTQAAVSHHADYASWTVMQDGASHVASQDTTAGTGHNQLTLLQGVSDSSPSSDFWNINFGSTMVAAAWKFVQWTSAPSPMAIKQVKAGSGTGTSGTITMDSAPAGTSVVFAVICPYASETVTVDSNFTAFGTTATGGSGSNTICMAAGWASNQQAATFTWTSNVNWTGFLVEVGNAGSTFALSPDAIAATSTVSSLLVEDAALVPATVNAAATVSSTVVEIASLVPAQVSATSAVAGGVIKAGGTVDPNTLNENTYIPFFTI